ncbi:MAG: hypothetical protein JST31_09495 [Actinobacteria bacterium]|nr:hypothetical protein [Actinomycetota bacterium]
MSGQARLSEVEYAELVGRVQAAVLTHVPAGASVLVVSKGDAALLELPSLRTAHFPQAENGGYAGHHPHDGGAVIAELEDLRRRGAEYLVIPATSKWWLDYYEGLGAHLAGHGALVAEAPGVCSIFSLGAEPPPPLLLTPLAPPRASVEQLREFLALLLPGTAASVVLEEHGEGIAAGLAPLRATALPLVGLDATSAIVELHERGRAGADYVVVPRPVDRWLADHAAVAAVLEEDLRNIADQRHLGRVFAIDERGEG